MLKVTRPRFRPRFPDRSFAPGLLFGSGIQGVWYDPSDFSTMFQDVAGTTPVTDVGQSVALIRDKSGNSNHATQSVLGSRPILNIDANGRYFLLFDGGNDSLLTGSVNFSATDKITVWSGVTKLNDAAAFGIVCEFGARGAGLAGSFTICAPASGGNYLFALEGTTSTDFTAATYTAPITNVISYAMDIAGAARSTEMFPRINASIPGTLTGGGAASAGTGNFGNYPLYIGRRNNATLPFSGRLYSLIVRGTSSTPSEIATTESWVNSKTGAY